MAQWLMSKALAEVMTATKCFQQNGQAQQAADLEGKLLHAQNGLTPQLWLQCRLQVFIFACSTQSSSMLHVTYKTPA